MKISGFLAGLSMTILMVINAQAQSPINITPGGTGQLQFEMANFPSPPVDPNAIYTYLWWFGDGHFSYQEGPLHDFDSIGQFNSMVIPTESYGSGGPPPSTVPFTCTTQAVSATPPGPLLPTGDALGIQHYRNAVAGDVVYFIITYGRDSTNNRHVSNGTISLVADPTYFRFLAADNPACFTAHGEDQQTGPNWNFDNLEKGEERHLLVGLRAEPAIMSLVGEDIGISARINFEASATSYTANLDLPVRKSHDPNDMTPSIGTHTDCELGGEKIQYKVRFQNTGDGPTSYVRLECQLDPALDLRTLGPVTAFRTVKDSLCQPIHRLVTPRTWPPKMWTHLDTASRTLFIEFHYLKLEGMLDTNVRNPELTKGWITFDVEVKNGYVVGDDIVCQTDIFFDDEDPIATNEAVTTCPEPVPTDPDPEPTNPLHGLPWWVWILIAILVIAALVAVLRKKR